MGFEIIDKFTCGKYGDPDRCEDVIESANGFHSLADGSSIGGPINGKPSGRLIAELFGHGLAHCAPDMAMDEALRTINAMIRVSLGYRDSAEVMAMGKRPAASAMILSEARDEIWMIGDTKLLVDGVEVDNSMRIDDVTIDKRCRAVVALLSGGHTVDTLMKNPVDMDCVMDLLDVQQAKYLNRPEEPVYGYAGIDGADDCIPMVKVVDIAGAREIVMASDGYPVLHSRRDESEAALTRMLAEDPLMYRQHKQVKGLRPGQVSFDDRAYLKLTRA